MRPTGRGGSSKSAGRQLDGHALGRDGPESHAALAVGHGEDRDAVTATPLGEHDDVAGSQPAQRRLDVTGVRSRPALGPRGEAPVLVDVAVGAGGRRSQLGQRRLAPLEPGLQLHDLPVGLVLRERQVQQVVGPIGGVGAHQVGRHVVGGPERRPQVEGPARRQRRHLVERDERAPEHHRVADVVDAPPPGPAGELRVVARGQERVVLAGELRQLLDHHRPRRHVDADRQGLGGEDDLHQPLDEAVLHGLLEGRHHAGVVGRDPVLEPGEELPVAEHGEVAVVHAPEVLVDDLADAVALGSRGEPQAGVEAGLGGVVAGVPAEDEVDGREHPLLLQPLDRLHPPRGVELATGPVAATAAPPAPHRLLVEPRRLGVGPADRRGSAGGAGAPRSCRRSGRGSAA